MSTHTITSDFTMSVIMNFLNITTCEKKNGLLLIEVFSKRNYGHQGSFLGGLSYLSGVVRISLFCQSECVKTMQEDK